jgi:hypothetical protein
MCLKASESKTNLCVTDLLYSRGYLTSATSGGFFRFSLVFTYGEIANPAAKVTQYPSFPGIALDVFAARVGNFASESLRSKSDTE